jgi:DNA-binding MarR family transcriptional regulator
MQNELHQELVQWLNLSVQRSMDAFMRFIREHDLTIQQMNVLMFLYYQGPAEITRLVAPLQVGKSAVSQMVERLVQLGLVERTSDQEDRRTCRVQVSPAAKTLIEEGIQARQNWLNEVFGDLPEDQYPLVLQALHILNQTFIQKTPGANHA